MPLPPPRRCARLSPASSSGAPTPFCLSNFVTVLEGESLKGTVIQSQNIACATWESTAVQAARTALAHRAPLSMAPVVLCHAAQPNCTAGISTSIGQNSPS